MSLIKTFDFNDEDDYDSQNIFFTMGVAKLLLIDNPGQIFSQNFSSDSGFTYDNTKAEFVGGVVRQKDQRPANALLAANYGSGVNANWATGSTTGTLGGGATVSGGKLVCTGGVRYADYSGVSNQTNQIGAIKFKVTPNYSGTPGAIMYYFAQAPAAGTRNASLQLFHSSADGNLAVFLRDDDDNLVAGFSFALFNPTAGTEYEIELNYNFTAGATRLFVNGVQQGSVLTATVTRNLSLGLIRLGAQHDASNGSNSSFDDLMMFSAVQHTANYTPGYSISPFVYLASEVALPAFTYTGVGTIQDVEDSDIVEAGAPRYTIADHYWNGSAWVPSNNTYAQANDSATILANLTELEVTGITEVIVRVYFDDSNSTQSSVNNLEVTLTGQKYAPEGWVQTLDPAHAEALINLSQDTIVPGSTAIKVIVVRGDDLLWFNGSTWATSDGTSAQANTLAVLNANLGSLTFSSNKLAGFRWVLTTPSNTTTPEIDEAVLEYNFGAVQPSVPDTCIVWAYEIDPQGIAVEGVKYRFRPDKGKSFYSEAASHQVQTESWVDVESDENGYWETDLIRSNEYEGTVKRYQIEKYMTATKTWRPLRNGSGIAVITVPDQDTANLTDLLTIS